MIPLFTMAWLAGFDFDEVLMVCTGLAAAAWVIMEFRRGQNVDDVLRDIFERVVRLEANSDDSVALEARLQRLEATAENHERIEERLSAYAERIAVLETTNGEDGE